MTWPRSFCRPDAWCLTSRARFASTTARSMKKYYGFIHQHPDLLEQAVYGLAEWSADQLKDANLIAVPGCYPTAAQLSLKPLIDAGLLDLSQWPVINATSGRERRGT
ncbi:N-acetyl-gamma-glutamyl-phosphate reductase [Citrobacter freundii]|nr:N-acetyl-gamma-glutamyl-phosphate reductase [Citrobacter freundii]